MVGKAQGSESVIAEVCCGTPHMVASWESLEKETRSKAGLLPSKVYLQEPVSMSKASPLKGCITQTALLAGVGTYEPVEDISDSNHTNF